MAVTKIIPIRFTIEKSLDYICNPVKTDGRLFVYSEHCSPQTAALTFQHYLNQARAGGNTIGRHLIQSFALGEVSAETAHEIGKRLADEILGGQYAYVLATHVDRGHIHNHFVWCAVNVETHKRYRSTKKTYHEIRNINDRLCEENNLSVIIPKGIGKSYTEYNAEKQGTSWKAKLKASIDSVILVSTDFENFLKRMEEQGYEVKRGKYISFRNKTEQERFIRTKSLGEDYTEEALMKRISEKLMPKKYSNSKNEFFQPKPLQNIIDIESNEKIKSSPGYEQWVKIFNLKQSSATLIRIEECGGIEAFDELYSNAIGDKLSLSQSLNGTEAEIKNLISLRNNLRAYGRTKAVYNKYLTSKHKDNFYHDNEADIIVHKAARKALSQAGQPVPSVSTINTEIDRLRACKTETQALYSQNENKLKEMEIIRKNLYMVLRQNNPQKQKNNNLYI